MKTKLKGILTLLLALVVQISFAQEKTVSGTVSEVSGALPGVSVVIKGTSTGTETDFDGKYSIKANTGAVLVFRYLGYTPVERTVGTSNTINVTLTVDENNVLDEVVIVAYGTSTKQAFTGTAKTVKAEQLEVKNISNISQALAGEIAGVTVINTSGQPGTTATIRIRGFGSVNGNRDPLYVLDGVPYDGTINSINPTDIASTTILKDATATAIYGSRGANGVILITTKSGKNGKSSIEIDMKTGVNFIGLPRHDVIRNPNQYLALSWEGLYNWGVASGQTDPEEYANENLFGGAGLSENFNYYNTNDVSLIIDPVDRTVRSGLERKYTPEDWRDYAFQASIRNEASVRMSGGENKTKYFSSFSYLDDKGYILNSNFTRYTTRLNITHQPTEWLNASANIGYTLSTTNNNGQSNDSGSVFWFVDNLPSIYPLFLRDGDGNTIEDTIFGGNIYDYGENGRGFGAFTNSIADSKYDISRTKRNEFNTNFKFDIKITKKITFENKVGFQYFMNRFDSYNNPFYGSSAGQGGSIFKRDTERTVQNYLQLLRYNDSFGDHNLNFLVAHESNSYQNKRNTASKNTAVSVGDTDLSNFINLSSLPTGTTNEETLESYFAQANYNYAGKYFISGSVRRDGSSKFQKGRWDTFGSIGASWILSKEGFFKLDFVEFFKLKASYGVVGDKDGIGYIPADNTFLIGNLNNNITLTPQTVGNPDLTWETSKTFQTGVEFTLGKYIDGSVDYYSKDTENLLFNVRPGSSVGFSSVLGNDGILRNSGFEFDLTAHLVNTEDFNLNLSINGATLNNQMITMPLDSSTGDPKVIDSSNTPFSFGKGISIFDYYLREYVGVDPSNGTSLWLQYYDDRNNNNILDPGEATTGAWNPTNGSTNTSTSYVEYLTLQPDANIKKKTTNTYSDATTNYVGKSAIPKLRGAFRLAATYKNFDISSQFIYSIGGYGYDQQYANFMGNGQVGGNNWHEDIFNRWQQPGDITSVPRISDNFDNRVNSSSTRFLISSDYLALNNLKVGYTVPSEATNKVGIKNLNIWISGDNLFLLSKRKGYNPTLEETGRSSVYNYSPLTTLTLGIRVKF